MLEGIWADQAGTPADEAAYTPSETISASSAFEPARARLSGRASSMRNSRLTSLPTKP